MGERLGAGKPKALVPIAGRPMVAHAVSAFEAASSVDRVIVVVPPGWEVELRAAVPAEVDTAVGGQTRQESVSAGLALCGGDVRVVAVHDAARPLVTPALIDRTVAALVPPWDAVAPGVAAVDTLKIVDGRMAVLRTVDRTDVWAVQTPQVCSRATLERVHARVASPADAATDDLSLVERAGGRVRLIEGERANFKITHPDDLALAAQLLGSS
jgi:2-C-methyl-D-erythritol 4-phosphate cytidylyltransferase